MAKSVGKKISDYAVWIILGLLCIGLIGFGPTNFGGGGQAVGTVGEKRVLVSTYFRALQTRLQQFQQQIGAPISFAEAEQFGLQQAVLSEIVTERALDNEAASLGLSVGDEAVSRALLSDPNFVGLDGQFDREGYRFALSNAGLTERAYETQLREAGARTLLQQAVIAGIEAPAPAVDAIISFAAETRDFTWANMGPADLIRPIGTPTEADLRAIYEGDPDTYTQPETKRLTYAWITPDMLLDTVEVEEELLQAAYDERIAEFVQPERRLVERLIFPDQAAAEAAAARIADGGTFEAEVDARGLQLADTDLGDVLPADLDGAADAVFAAEAPEVVGPLETSLGPALFRVNAVLPARETTFEEARDDLQDDLALDRARRVIAQMIDEADNELAGGATLEEVVEVTDLELGTLDWFPGVEADITGYEAFRTAAAEVTESDFPEMAALDDGGIFALRLDETIPPALRPFEDVRPALEEAWTRQATTEALVALAQTLEPQIAGGMDMATLGLTAQEESDLPRTAFVPDAPADFLIEVFDMASGETLIIPGDGRVALVRLDAVNAADLNDPDTAALANAVTAQVGQDYALDLYQVFSQGVVDKTSITLDQAALNSIHSQF